MRSLAVALLPHLFSQDEDSDSHHEALFSGNAPLCLSHIKKVNMENVKILKRLKRKSDRCSSWHHIRFSASLLLCSGCQRQALLVSGSCILAESHSRKSSVESEHTSPAPRKSPLHDLSAANEYQMSAPASSVRRLGEWPLVLLPVD